MIRRATKTKKKQKIIHLESNRLIDEKAKETQCL